MTTDFRRGAIVSVPCRGCGRTFHKLTVLQGVYEFKCSACGKTTRVRIRAWGEIHRVFTERLRST